jgi:hypothetical protein
MKRSFALYLISAWCFLALLVQASSMSRVFGPLLFPDQNPATLSLIFMASGCLIAVWNSALLLELKPLNRWASIVFLSIWAFTLLWNCFVFAPRAPSPMIAVVIFLTLAALNITSAWYLWRWRKIRPTVRSAPDRLASSDANASDQELTNRVTE